MTEEHLDEFARKARQPVRVRDAAIDNVDRMIRTQRSDPRAWVALGVAAGLLIMAGGFIAGMKYGRANIDSVARNDDHRLINCGTSCAQTPSKGVDVTFVLVEPGAHQVAVVGAFNDWSPNR